MNLASTLKSKPICYDGSKGSLLFSRGLSGVAEGYNLTNPEAIFALHSDYIKAGAQAIQTNTFGANAISLARHGLDNDTESINAAAFEIAKSAAKYASDVFLIASAGPTGEMLEPYGTLSAEEVTAAYLRQMSALKNAGCEYVHLETFYDLAELRASAVAAKSADLQIIASMTFTEAGRTVMGDTPEDFARTMADFGAICVGVNCMGEPQLIVTMLEKIRAVCDLPLIVKPNAGLPEVVDGKTIYNLAPADFCAPVGQYINAGAKLIGGCCGTTPEHMKMLSAELQMVDRK